MRTSSVLALGLVVGGCFGPPSKVDSNATLTVGGSTERQDGSADAASKIVLIRHPDALQAIGDVVTIIGSVGLACVVGNDSLCDPYARASAGHEKCALPADSSSLPAVSHSRSVGMVTWFAGR